MNNSEKIEIPISKVKIMFLLLVSLAFLLVSAWLLSIHIDEHTPFWEMENVFINIVCVLGLLMGLFGSYFFIKKLFDDEPGLVIDELGIIDNSGGVSVGRIYWVDIIGVQEYLVEAGSASSQKFVSIFLVNPEDYIARQPNSFKRKMIQANAKYSGTPVSISANSLKISFEELYGLIEMKFMAFRNTN